LERCALEERISSYSPLDFVHPTLVALVHVARSVFALPIQSPTLPEEIMNHHPKTEVNPTHKTISKEIKDPKKTKRSTAPSPQGLHKPYSIKPYYMVI